MPLRPYDQEQIFLLPHSLNEWVRHDHPARVFSEIIDRMDTRPFREPKEEGRPAYHPKMMLKVLLWGYATGVRSSRKVEEKLQQDIVFMWLAGLEKPDFRTLCLFRSTNREAVKRVFADVITIAQSMGMANLGLVAMDGSKVQANSGIDSFKTVGDWREALEKAKGEARRIIAEAERIDQEENDRYGEKARGNELPKEIEKTEDRIEKIEELLERAKKLGKEEKARMSLTDQEASFMHKRATSIPAYNAQLVVTEDQIIIHADVTTEPVDVNQTKIAVERIEKQIGETPGILVADTGYGGGDNLKYLEDNDIDAYIPEEGERNIGKAKRSRAHLFGKRDFTYSEREDCYICPIGKTLCQAVSTRTIKTKYSKRAITVYRTRRGVCTQCPHRERCTPNAKVGRSITRDGYEEYRERMREKMTTAKGRAIYGKRKCIVEPVFGQIKTRGRFDQFLLRGLEKVRLEWKVAAIAHNLMKIIADVVRRRRMIPVFG
jgi:transposase